MESLKLRGGKQALFKDIVALLNKFESEVAFNITPTKFSCDFMDASSAYGVIVETEAIFKAKEEHTLFVLLGDLDKVLRRMDDSYKCKETYYHI